MTSVAHECVVEILAAVSVLSSTNVIPQEERRSSVKINLLNIIAARSIILKYTTIVQTTSGTVTTGS
jgi:hypothetical protein